MGGRQYLSPPRPPPLLQRGTSSIPRCQRCMNSVARLAQRGLHFRQVANRVVKHEIVDHSVRHSPTQPERLIVKGTGQVSFVRISDIDWIEAADYYACLHVGTKTHLLRRSLSELEKELNRHTFCRIHRSTIVNFDRVEGLKINEEGEHDVLLDNGVRVRLSRRYRKQLQSRLGIHRSLADG